MSPPPPAAQPPMGRTTYRCSAFSEKPSGSSISANAISAIRDPVASFRPDTPGLYTLNFTIKGHGATYVDTVTVRVLDANDPDTPRALRDEPVPPGVVVLTRNFAPTTLKRKASTQNGGTAKRHVKKEHAITTHNAFPPTYMTASTSYQPDYNHNHNHNHNHDSHPHPHSCTHHPQHKAPPRKPKVPIAHCAESDEDMPFRNPDEHEPPNYDDHIRNDDSVAQRDRPRDRSESEQDDDEDDDDHHNDNSQMRRRRSSSAVENDDEDDDDEEEEEEEEEDNDKRDDERIQRFAEPSYGKDPADEQGRGYSSNWRHGGESVNGHKPFDDEYDSDDNDDDDDDDDDGDDDDDEDEEEDEDDHDVDENRRGDQ